MSVATCGDTAPGSLLSHGYILLHQGDAIDLDVERPGPFGHAHEDARRRIFRKIARVDRLTAAKCSTDVQ